MPKSYEGKYKNFMFMAGWRDMLEGMEKDFGLDYAKEALWQLMLVGTLEEQEVVTEKKSIAGFIEGCVLPVLKNSTANHNKNRENGLKGGRPTAEIDIEDAIRLHDEEGKTWKEVAKIKGVSPDTLKKYRDMYEAEKPKNPKIETEKSAEKIEKPENQSDNSFYDNSDRKTEEPEKKKVFYF